MGTLVAIVDVRVEMDVVFTLRAKLLTTIWEREGGEREREREAGVMVVYKTQLHFT